MKWVFSTVALILATLVSGCSSDYVMATKDGKMIMTQGKPEIDKDTGLVKYIDNAGHEVQINGDDISSIVER
ncbi:YgdI/YgdR family lipoprotein [Erwinia endophytica]|uniref:YgdI/YgdR family lipoprotein n=1 Tax=Erwinia endophytica TaxID=1563158 RepID=UPI001265E055|nr:YgdI/YgdR family lipoprotein [Erwinia endophytica]KAB8305291.1 YgdI/YgdR family lipoprotein [Erwinia endophytica]